MRKIILIILCICGLQHISISQTIRKQNSYWEIILNKKVYQTFPSWKFILRADSNYSEENRNYKLTIFDQSNNKLIQVLTFESAYDTIEYKSWKDFNFIQDFFDDGYFDIVIPTSQSGSGGQDGCTFWFFNVKNNLYNEKSEDFFCGTKFFPDSTFTYGVRDQGEWVERTYKWKNEKFILLKTDSIMR